MRSLHPPAALAAVLVMGVSGVGKSTIAEGLARRRGWRYVDADALHPAANIAKMRSGVALDDMDRAPWLTAVRSCIEQARAVGSPVVLACSALKRVYRDTLRAGTDDVFIVYLTAPPEVLAARLQARTGHFMPATLLDSQIATLEPPAPAEHALVVSAIAPPDTIVATVDALLRKTIDARPPH